MALAKSLKKKLYVYLFRKEKFIDRIFVSNSNICSKSWKANAERHIYNHKLNRS